jgi:ubiquinone/menaquinone biosynthesis C-methylase UbiE
MTKHAERIREQFDKQAAAYVKLDFASEMGGLKRVAGFTRVGEGDRVLDVACGPGFLTMALAMTGATATGLDFTPAFLALGQLETRERGIDGCSRARGLVERMPFPDATFNVSICRAAFHHFPKPAAVLAEMKRVTKPGGKLFVLDLVSSPDPEKASKQNAMEKLCDPTHVEALSETKFQRMFEDAGLKLADTRYAETKYAFDEWLTHGGPSPENAERLRVIFRESLVHDTLGLRIWEEDGAIHFAHPGAAFVLNR